MNEPICRDAKIFSGDLLARALRDSGYKNTAYALAELIDNSIQANATEVEVLCFEKSITINEYTRKRISHIAVIDNGHGMEDDVLRAALMFGNGTRLNDRTGIGRFGMGLPNASFSQAKHVEVWSWVNGPTNALWTYIDFDEIVSNKTETVPIPAKKELPNFVYDVINMELSDHGTIVLWTKFDDERLTWKTARSTLENTEHIAGRVYRRFLSEGKTSIRMAAFNEDLDVVIDRHAKPNDPLYLLQRSTTPEPYADDPMFQEWGDEKFPVEWKGEPSEIIVRFSYAKQSTVTNTKGSLDRGSMPYGKHAAKNIGVSLVRAGRELELDPSWAIGYDPKERWWGCEVEFPPHLDDMFGVTINKQAATLWSQFSQNEWESLADDGETTSPQVVERLSREGDPRGPLLAVSQYIKRQLKQIRKALDSQKKVRNKGNLRHDAPTPEDTATEKIRQRAEENPVPQDEQEFGPEEAEGLKKDLVENKKYPEEVAQDIVFAVWRKELRVCFLESALDGHAFFKVEERPGGIAEVIINTEHPFYERLYKALKFEGVSDGDLPDDLDDTGKALWLLFAAWARYEQESSEKERRRLDDVRQDWGRMARFFLEKDED